MTVDSGGVVVEDEAVVVKEASALWVLLVLVVVAGGFPTIRVERVKIMHVTMSFDCSSCPPSITTNAQPHYGIDSSNVTQTIT